MSTFTYSPVSHLYAPWPQTFDASSISRQAMPGGFATWFGQLTDGNSFWLTQSGTNIVAMTISDGTTDYVTATMALPAAPLEALLAAANNDPAAWTAYLLSAADTIVGSRAGDRLYAGAGNDDIGGGMGADTIYAGAGDDTVNGGDGIDTASYAGSKTAVIADLASGIADGEGHDTLIAIENVTGSAFADTLAGDAGANQMLGGAGDDTIAGGLGDDRLAGGEGRDTADYSAAAGPVSVDLATHTASGEGSDTLAGIENVAGSAYGDTLTGDTGRNVLSGGDGNDTIAGGGGADSLAGGLGDDVLDGSGGAATASYALAQYGIVADLVLGTASGEGSDTLVAIRNLEGSNQADQLTGDGAANALNGGAGDDVLAGGDGADVLAGGFGSDALDGGAGNDTASFAAAAAAVAANLVAGTALGEGSDTFAGIENLIGSVYGDALTGDGGDNRLSGGGGHDTLLGGAGRDLLAGGTGADRFVYAALTDSTVAAAGRDTIQDFSHAAGDRIDLAAIDADTTLDGDQAFHLGGAAFSHSAGELIQYVVAGRTMLLGDVDGNGTADFALQLDGAPVLAAGDFLF